jgi:hypothetical protein
MSRIEFLGRVFPPGAHISINNAPRVRLPIRNLPFAVDITAIVADSEVRIICDLPVPFQLENLTNIYVDVITFVQGMVNLVGFHLGAGVIVCIDCWVDPLGNETEVALADPNLPQCCTAFNGTANFQEIVKLLIAEPAIHMALNDLILGQIFSNHALINCARAVEGIRHMIAGPGTDPRKAWPITCNALNVDRSYIQPITEYSTKPRHGNVVVVDGTIIREIAQRSWILMDRFFHYRLLQNQRLAAPQFPLLRN